MGKLYDYLEDVGYGDIYSFQRPGSKSNYYENDFYSEFYKRDLSCIDNYDDYTEAGGLIRESMERVARAYNADESFYLLNGPSSGVMAAFFGTLNKGDTILLMRNSAKYVYEAAMLRELNIEYIVGETDEELGLVKGISLDKLKEVYEKTDKISAVVLTSPTPEGISSELDDIADYLHEKRVPLIVDASYGAHFGFAGFLPINAVECGADVVIHSPFNTLPSPMQASIMHVNGSIVNVEKIKKYIRCFSNDCPSYVLMAGVDECIRYLTDDKTPWEEFYRKRERLSYELKDLENLCIFDAFTSGRGTTPEIGKMLVYCKDTKYDGRQLSDKLRKEYKIKISYSMPGYVLLMFSICDIDEGYSRIKDALLKMDREISERKEKTLGRSAMDLGSLESMFGISKGANSRIVFPSEKEIVVKKSVAVAANAEKEAVPFGLSEGRTAGEYLYVKSVRQPIIVPGEQITKNTIALVNQFRTHKIALEGMLVDRFEVLRETKDDSEKHSQKDNEKRATGNGITEITEITEMTKKTDK